jgi:hypothetical protein
MMLSMARSVRARSDGGLCGLISQLPIRQRHSDLCRSSRYAGIQGWTEAAQALALGYDAAQPAVGGTPT